MRVGAVLLEEEELLLPLPDLLLLLQQVALHLDALLPLRVGLWSFKLRQLGKEWEIEMLISSVLLLLEPNEKLIWTELS